MKVPPPLTQQSSARAQSQPASAVQSQYAFFQFHVQGWVRAKLKTGDGGKTCEMGGGQRVIDFKTSSHCTALYGARAPGWNWSSLKTRQTAAVCFQVEVVLLSGAYLCALLSCFLQFLPRLLFTQVKWEFLRTPGSWLLAVGWGSALRIFFVEFDAWVEVDSRILARYQACHVTYPLQNLLTNFNKNDLAYEPQQKRGTLGVTNHLTLF